MKKCTLFIIPQSKFPDTYGEWWVDYLDNVIIPHFTDPLLLTPASIEIKKKKTDTIAKEIEEAKRYYDIGQPKFEGPIEINFSIGVF